MHLNDSQVINKSYVKKKYNCKILIANYKITQILFENENES